MAALLDEGDDHDGLPADLQSLGNEIGDLLKEATEELSESGRATPPPDGSAARPEDAAAARASTAPPLDSDGEDDDDDLAGEERRLDASASTLLDELIEIEDRVRGWSRPKLKGWLLAFYSEHNASKIGEIDAIMKKYAGREPLLVRRLEKKYAPPWYEETLEETYAPPPKKSLGKPAGLGTPPPSPVRLAAAAAAPPPPDGAPGLGALSDHLRYLLDPLKSDAPPSPVDLLGLENARAAPPDLLGDFAWVGGDATPPLPDPSDVDPGSPYVDPFADTPRLLRE